MTVTTNSLGSNSAEIIVSQETGLYTNVMTAIDTFVTAHGWTAKTAVGNTMEKVYQSANAVGGGTKEIKINALDLHIQLAESFSGTTTVTSTNPIFPHRRLDHITAADYLYATATTTNSFGTNGSYWPNQDTNETITIAAAQSFTLYEHQLIRLIHTTDDEYWFEGRVVSHNNTTGEIVFSLTDSNYQGNYQDTSADVWNLCIDRLNYVDDTSPAHIFISATSKHIAIQCRNTNNSWHDFTAICETENPLSLSDSAILTTGYMLGNSGYVKSQWQEFDYGNNSTTYTLDEFDAPNTTETNTIGYGGKMHKLTGPFQSVTSIDISGVNSARSTSIVTDIGTAGYIGAVYRHSLWGVNFPGTDTTPELNEQRLNFSLEKIIYFKGMGDIIPADLEASSSKHWALSGYANLNTIEDAGGSIELKVTTNETDLLDISNSLSGDQAIYRSATSSYTSYNGNHVYDDSVNSTNNYRNLTSTRAKTPTMMGRIYNLKFMTTGIPASSVIGVKIDANGFPDANGTDTDHLIFSAGYVEYSSNVNKNGTAFTDASLDWYDDEDTDKEAKIEKSKRVAIGFPL
jgi:hypothetical protein